MHPAVLKIESLRDANAGVTREATKASLLAQSPNVIGATKKLKNIEVEKLRTGITNIYIRMPKIII